MGDFSIQTMAWWVLPAVLLVAAVAAFFFLRARPRVRSVTVVGAGPGTEGTQLAPAAIRRLVDLLCPLVDSHYVDPEMARRLAEHLAERGSSGAYAGLSDPQRLAERLTLDLQELSRDRHLRVVYRPGEVVEGPRIVIDPPSGLFRGRRSRPRAGPGPVVEVVTEGPAEGVARGGGPEVEVVVDAPEGPETEAAPAEGPESAPHGIAQVEILAGNVGYLDLRELRPVRQAGGAVVAALNTLAEVDAVILDLRQNTGGGPEMVQLVASYFFGREPVLLNTYYDRPIDRTTELWTLAEVEGPRLTDVPLFLLTSHRTFSAAESLAYTLKHHGRAEVIGEVTGGGAHPNVDLPLPHGLVALVPVARSIHPVTGTDWEGVGVQPDLEVAAGEALEVAYREAMRRISGKPGPEAGTSG